MTRRFYEYYQQEYVAIFSTKLGLATPQPGDKKLIQDFLDLLQGHQADFTLAFRRLGELPVDENAIKPLFDFPESFDSWLSLWRDRCTRETTSDKQRHQQMMTVNPAFIPRNHLVEEAIQKAYAGDFSLFHEMNRRLSKPFAYDADDKILASPPRPDQIVQQTFCGT